MVILNCFIIFCHGDVTTSFFHSITCVVPRVRVLHFVIVTSTCRLLGLSTQRHAVLFSLNDASKPLTFKSFLLYSNHVFLGRPLGLLPVTIVLFIFLGYLSGSMRWRWPYQRRRHPIDSLVHLMVSYPLASWSRPILLLSYCDWGGRHFLCCSPHFTGMQ